MTFQRFSILFTFALFLLAAWAVWEARKWPLQASLIPWLIGVPTVILLAVELIREWMGRGAKNAAEDEETDMKALGVSAISEVGDSVDPAEERRRMVNIICWILGFALAILLLGFQLGISLLTLLYLTFAGTERWTTILGMTAIVWAATTLFFDCTMHIFFAEGKLLVWLGLSSNEFYTDVCQVFSDLFK